MAIANLFYDDNPDWGAPLAPAIEGKPDLTVLDGGEGLRDADAKRPDLTLIERDGTRESVDEVLDPKEGKELEDEKEEERFIPTDLEANFSSEKIDLTQDLSIELKDLKFKGILDSVSLDGTPHILKYSFLGIHSEQGATFRPHYPTGLPVIGGKYLIFKTPKELFESESLDFDASFDDAIKLELLSRGISSNVLEEEEGFESELLASLETYDLTAETIYQPFKGEILNLENGVELPLIGVRLEKNGKTYTGRRLTSLGQLLFVSEDGEDVITIARPWDLIIFDGLDETQFSEEQIKGLTEMDVPEERPISPTSVDVVKPGILERMRTAVSDKVSKTLLWRPRFVRELKSFYEDFNSEIVYLRDLDIDCSTWVLKDGDVELRFLEFIEGEGLIFMDQSEEATEPRRRMSFKKVVDLFNCEFLVREDLPEEVQDVLDWEYPRFENWMGDAFTGDTLELPNGAVVEFIGLSVYQDDQEYQITSFDADQNLLLAHRLGDDGEPDLSAEPLSFATLGDLFIRGDYDFLELPLAVTNGLSAIGYDYYGTYEGNNLISKPKKIEAITWEHIDADASLDWIQKRTYWYMLKYGLVSQYVVILDDDEEDDPEMDEKEPDEKETLESRRSRILDYALKNIFHGKRPFVRAPIEEFLLGECEETIVLKGRGADDPVSYIVRIGSEDYYYLPVDQRSFVHSSGDLGHPFIADTIPGSHLFDSTDESSDELRIKGLSSFPRLRKEGDTFIVVEGAEYELKQDVESEEGQGEDDEVADPSIKPIGRVRQWLWSNLLWRLIKPEELMVDAEAVLPTSDGLVPISPHVEVLNEAPVSPPLPKPEPEPEPEAVQAAALMEVLEVSESRGGAYLIPKRIKATLTPAVLSRWFTIANDPKDMVLGSLEDYELVSPAWVKDPNNIAHLYAPNDPSTGKPDPEILVKGILRYVGPQA